MIIDHKQEKYRVETKQIEVRAKLREVSIIQLMFVPLIQFAFYFRSTLLAR